jgi:hypothetical protein
MHRAIGNNHHIATEALAVLAQECWQIRGANLFFAIVEEFDPTRGTPRDRSHRP